MASPASPALMHRIRTFPEIAHYGPFTEFLQEIQRLFPEKKFLCTHQVPTAGAQVLEVTVEITSCEGDADLVVVEFLAIMKAKHPEWDAYQLSQ